MQLREGDQESFPAQDMWGLGWGVCKQPISSTWSVKSSWKLKVGRCLHSGAPNPQPRGVIGVKGGMDPPFLLFHFLWGGAILDRPGGRWCGGCGPTWKVRGRVDESLRESG